MEKMEEDWNVYPVLHFDLSMGKHMDKEELERYLDFLLKEEENKYGIESNLVDVNTRLTHLIKTAYRKTGQPVVVLIDEYDAPLLDVVHEDGQLDGLRNLMRNFYYCCPVKFRELDFLCNSSQDFTGQQKKIRQLTLVGSIVDCRMFCVFIAHLLWEEAFVG